MKTLKFPKGFLWGSATSAYQVEGGVENSDWSKDFPAGKACDHYNLYEKDSDLIQSLNQNAYRFSIEWSRIEPEPGKFDAKELEHYWQVLHSLKMRGIKTMLTLHHFTSPLWLAKIGGWTNPKVVSYFSRFAERVFDEYFDLVDFWATINEPLVYASISYFQGRWPPKKKSLVSLFKVIKNQISVHKKIYNIFHKSKRLVRLGIVKNNNYFQPFNPKSPFDRIGIVIHRYLWSHFFLNRIKNHLDFIGLNYYSRELVRLLFIRKPEGKTKLSDVGWEICPGGIYHVLKDLKRYNLPIYITENGLADKQDKYRKEFIRDHLYWIHKAIQDYNPPTTSSRPRGGRALGIDVRGYFHWSLMDNFEWDSGFDPRFGLIEIDYETLERKPRPSAFYYSDICKVNQLTINSKF